MGAPESGGKKAVAGLEWVALRYKKGPNGGSWDGKGLNKGGYLGVLRVERPGGGGEGSVGSRPAVGRLAPPPGLIGH